MTPHHQPIILQSGERLIWGTEEDLATNRTGVMTDMQRTFAKRSGIALPIIALVLGGVLWGGVLLAFRGEPYYQRAVIGFGILVLIPCGILVFVGHRSRKAHKQGISLMARGPAALAPGGSKLAAKIDVRVGDAVVPLLPAWAAVFQAGEHYEIHYSPADHNILSGIWLATPAPAP